MLALLQWVCVLFAVSLWIPCKATVEVVVTYESQDLVFGPNTTSWSNVPFGNGICGTGYSQSSTSTFSFVSLVFRGTGVSIDMIRSVNGSKVAIDIDGSSVDVVDTYLDHVDCKTPVFQRSGLKYGDHTIRISDPSYSPRQMRFEGFRYTTYTDEELASLSASQVPTVHVKDWEAFHRIEIAILAVLSFIALLVTIGFLMGCIWFLRQPTRSERYSDRWSEGTPKRRSMLSNSGLPSGGS